MEERRGTGNGGETRRRILKKDMEEVGKGHDEVWRRDMEGYIERDTVGEDHGR